MDKVFSDFACLGTNAGPPPGLELTFVAAKPTLAPGDGTEITITFTNTTDAPVGWGMMTMPGYDLFPLSTKNARGENVTPAYPCDRGPMGNTGAPMVIVLAAHGVGHVKRTWRAFRSAGKCGDGVPLEPGAYTVGVGFDPIVRVKPLAIVVAR